MKHSTDRILVSHVGSLARPKDLMEMLVARNDGKPYDSAALAKRMSDSVAEVVQKQIECGIDVVNDGEMGKSNFSRYTKERLGGVVERDGGAGLQANVDLRSRHEGVHRVFQPRRPNLHRPSRPGVLLCRAAQVRRPGRGATPTSPI